MKSKRWAPPKKLGLMKVRGGHPFGLMQIPKNAEFVVVEMAKNLVHSFYYILYQPKGVTTPRDNFSGSGGNIHSQFCEQIRVIVIYLFQNKNIILYLSIYFFHRFSNIDQA